MISEIQTIRKLNNPTTTLSTGLFLTIVRFKPARMIGIYFCTIHLVWIHKLKQPIINIKVMTENRAYCGFQE